jgi:dipeptidyl-peptidase-4
LIAFSRDKLFPEVTASLEKATGYKSYFYGNFDPDHTRWTSAGFPATPRFGTTYIGLRNRLSILSEAYSYASFKDRVLVTRDFCLASLQFVVDHRDEIRKLLDDARNRTVLSIGEPVAIRSKAQSFPSKTTVLGFVERRENGRNVATAEPKDYSCDIELDFVPSLEVRKPFAYLIPPQYAKAIEVVRAHGIKTETLDANYYVPVEAEEIVKFTRARRASEGHETIDVTETAIKPDRRVIPAGTIVVRTAQPLGTLAVYLLEPRSDDGLLTWNYFDEALAPAREFPVLRIRDEIPIASTPSE